MAGSQYYSNTNSRLFSVEDDIDDNEFLNHSTSGRTGYMLPQAVPPAPTVAHSSSIESLEERRQQLLQKKKEIEERTLQSTQRSVGYLRNSEEVGITTAEELVRQREQLERTEKRLDDINTNLRVSQKHIQGIKSVFGGLMNKLTGRSNTSEPTLNNQNYVPSKSPLVEVIDKTSADIKPPHPGLRIRGLSDEDDNPRGQGPSQFRREPPGDAQQAIDQNLEVMMGSISRLKGLAFGLGEEINAHNELIENVITKAEKADTSMNRQNKDLKRLLK